MQLLEHLEAAPSQHGTGIRAMRDIPAGTPLFKILGTPGSRPDKYSLQSGENLHIHPADGNLWRLVNHSCDPNCLIDFKTWTFVTAQDVKKDEEFTFNYLTTEYKMVSPFRCGCGSANCKGEIRGFKFLSSGQLEELAHRGAPYFLQHLFETAPLPSIPRRSGISFEQWRPAVYALIPYSITDGKWDGGEYDYPAYRSEVRSWFKNLGLPYRWVPVLHGNLDKTMEKLREYFRSGDILAFNFCDGCEKDGIPGISVVRALEDSQIPFTGASHEFFYRASSKMIMKEKLVREKVPTAPFLYIDKPEDVSRLGSVVGYPALFKPNIASASWGIFVKSCVTNEQAAVDYAKWYLSDDYRKEYGLFAEKFVDGPEFTVFVLSDPESPLGVQVYPPAERHINPAFPRYERFLSYGRYWEEYSAEETPPPAGEKFVVYKSADPKLCDRIADTARRAYLAVNGKGYSRVDIRMEERTGELFVLEVNSKPGFSAEGYCSLGNILRLAGLSILPLISDVLKDAFRRSSHL